MAMSKVAAKSTTAIEGKEINDPVLLMLGVGKHVWESEPGDKFVERLRSEDEAPRLLESSQLTRLKDSPESVWRRILDHQGEEFKTATQLPFTYEVEGTGIWFYRNGRRINRKLTRSQLEKAIERCPLNSTTEIKDLMDYAYLFGVLMDARIRCQAW
jgi:hypothetical protein